MPFMKPYTQMQMKPIHSLTALRFAARLLVSSFEGLLGGICFIFADAPFYLSVNKQYLRPLRIDKSHYHFPPAHLSFNKDALQRQFQKIYCLLYAVSRIERISFGDVCNCVIACASANIDVQTFKSD